MKAKKHNPFHGTWVVVRTQMQNGKGEWDTCERVRFGDWVWRFHPEPRRDHAGKITESLTDAKVFVSDYLFCTEEAVLFTSDPDRDDPFWECRNEKYRIGAKRNALILYDNTEPGGCGFRIILKRGNALNRLAAILFPSRK